MMTVIKAAPALVPADKGPVLGKLISHQAYRNMELQRQADCAKGSLERMQESRELHDEWRVKQLQREANPHGEMFNRVGEAYEKRDDNLGFYGRLANLEPELVAQAIHHAREMASLKSSLAETVRRQIEDMEQAVADVQQSRAWRRLQHELAKMQ